MVFLYFFFLPLDSSILLYFLVVFLYRSASSQALVILFNFFMIPFLGGRFNPLTRVPDFW